MSVLNLETLCLQKCSKGRTLPLWSLRVGQSREVGVRKEALRMVHAVVWASALKLHTRCFLLLPSAAPASFSVSLLLHTCPASLDLSSVIHPRFHFHDDHTKSPQCPPAATSRLPSIFPSRRAAPWPVCHSALKSPFLIFSTCQYPLLWVDRRVADHWFLTSCLLHCHPGPRPH